MLAAIAFLFCLFLGRFFYVQLVWERELLARAVDQWTRELPVAPERGNIFDASGELLAGNTAAYTLYARANAVKDAEKTARALSSLLPLSYESLLTKLSDRSSSEIVLLRRAEKETVAAVEGTNLVHDCNPQLVEFPSGTAAGTITVDTQVQPGSLLIVRNEDGTNAQTVGGATCAKQSVTTLLWDGAGYITIGSTSLAEEEGDE